MKGGHTRESGVRVGSSQGGHTRESGFKSGVHTRESGFKSGVHTRESGFKFISAYIYCFVHLYDICKIL